MVEAQVVSYKTAEQAAVRGRPIPAAVSSRLVISGIDGLPGRTPKWA
jgi:hypothetical protein